MVPGQPWGWMPWGMMWLFPLVMLVVMVVFLYLFLVRGVYRPPLHPQSPGSGGSESALDILKKRYARGEITKDEFDRMKKDIE
jgi:putative membrane protein